MTDLRTAPVILLDDSIGGEERSGSLIFQEPVDILTATSLDDARETLAKIDAYVARGYYAAGWISYECASVFEPKLDRPDTLADEPLIWMMISEAPMRLAEPELTAVLHESARGNRRYHRLTLSDLNAERQERYFQALNRIQNYIRAGDIYQANYTFPLDVRLTGDPLSLYRELRQAQPVEYGAYIDTGDHKVLSFSPELFFRANNGHITAKPMKGTIARGRFASEDRANAALLRSDAKSRAENLMIVDLIRNDLSKVSEPGSVRVETLYDTETYPTVLQMTSTITSRARKSMRPSEILKALFPCGSVTGAPKIRAMQILSELETGPRGVYCGAIGYFGPDQNWCFNVPIRTMLLTPQETTPNDPLPVYEGRYHVGSGIVADSKPADEFAECEIKTRFLKQTPKTFALIETLLLQGGDYCFLPQHLKRLRESAGYFGFRYDEESVVTALRDHQACLGEAGQYKVRILCDRSGALTVTSEELPAFTPVMTMDALAQDPNASYPSVDISNQRVSSDDIFLFHKTTSRTLYDSEFTDATSQGYSERLFLNESGDLTEGCVSNLFVKIDDCWYTPVLECGLLAGVLRADLLAKGLVTEARLTLADLGAASSVAVGNSVRGLRLVRPDTRSFDAL